VRTIVIATDGSSASREALVFGLDLAMDERADVVVVHVAQRFDLVPTSPFGLVATQAHAPTAAERAILDDALATAESAGVSARGELLVGDPADEIVASADTIDADLIVVGWRGHGALSSAVHGSVSRGVLNYARRPVLVVRGTRVASSTQAAAASSRGASRRARGGRALHGS
jgi:nucleotide-binding universal stress UspA family protein